MPQRMPWDLQEEIITLNPTAEGTAESELFQLNGDQMVQCLGWEITADPQDNQFGNVVWETQLASGQWQSLDGSGANVGIVSFSYIYLARPPFRIMGSSLEVASSELTVHLYYRT